MNDTPAPTFLARRGSTEPRMHSDRAPSKSIRTIAAVALVLIACSAAEANPGTAILYRTAFHLVVANFVIAIIEYLIARRFGAERGRFKLFVGANYVSAWVGLLVLVMPGLTSMFAIGAEGPVEAYFIETATIIGMMLLLTIAIEWGFFWCAFAVEKRKVGRVAAAFLTAHLVTYAALTIYYLPDIKVNLLTEYTWVDDPAQVIQLEPLPWVYYIGADESSVWRVHPDGSKQECIASGLNLAESRLCAEWTGARRFALGIVSVSDAPNGWRRDAVRGEPCAVEVLDFDIGEAASLFLNLDAWAGEISRWDDTLADYRLREAQSLLIPGEAAQLHRADESLPAYMWWLGESIERRTPASYHEISLFNGIPNTGVLHRGISVLPNDQLVWEMTFGLHRFEAPGRPRPYAIYVMSNEHKRIARLAYGRSPIVAYEVAPEGWVNPLVHFEESRAGGQTTP